MLYVAVAVGLAVLIGIHELVVLVARRTIRRPWAVLLGPVVGYLVLVGCALALYMTFGLGGDRMYIVGEVLPGYDAVGKLAVGDRIHHIDDVEVAPLGTTLGSQVEAAGGKPVKVTLERGGARQDITVQPRQSDVRGRMVWLLGIRPSLEDVRVHDTEAAVKGAFMFPIRATRDAVDQIRMMIESNEKPDIGGPVRIVAVLSDTQRPAAQRALEGLLRTGFFVWTALFLLDLVRLWRLSRPADARSSQTR